MEQMNMATETKKKRTYDSNYKRTPSKKEREAAENLMWLRLLIIIAVDILFGVLFNAVTTSGSDVEFKFYMNVRPVLLVVSIILFLAAAGYMAFTIVKKVDTSRRPMTPEMILGVALFFLISILGYNIFRLNASLYYVIMIVGSVLFAVYYIYTKMLYR